MLLVILMSLLAQVMGTLPRVKVNSDTFFEGSDGRVLIFHGSSYVNKLDDLVHVSDEDMELAATQWGYNIARIGFLWNLAEPSPNTYNTTYLTMLQDLVQRFANHGIYSLLDMHQDLWANRYCGQGIPDFYANPYDPYPLPFLHLYRKDQLLTFPRPVAEPQYATGASGNFPPITNCASVRDDNPIGWAGVYGTYALGAAAQRMYDNSAGYSDKFARFWKDIATTFHNETSVVGYELLNEPWLGDVWVNPALLAGATADLTNLAAFNTKLHNSIRTVDNDTIIFFEPATGGSFFDYGPVGFLQGPGGASYNDRQALSYHVYCPGTSSGPACDAITSAAGPIREADVRRLGVGGLMTEFGSIDFGNADLLANIIASMNQMDSYLRGWVYWLENPTSSSDPRRYHTLARTYAKAIAGKPTNMSFDPTTGAFTLTYNPHASDTVAALPTEIFASFTQYYPDGLTCTLTPSDVGTCTVYESDNKVLVQLNNEHLDTPVVTVTIVAI